jgi:DNA-binding CsgD family transcriptional regulator
MRDNWHIFTDMFAQVGFGWPDSDTAAGYAQLMRDAITQEAMLRAWKQTMALDVTDEARAVRVPTLILVRRGATISGVEDARELAGLIPSARLLILDGSSHAPFLENPELVTAAIREFIASEPVIRTTPPAAAPLTEREQQVLRLLANGRTGKEIASELVISVPTVQRHIANIYAKIGARGRVEAAAYAFEQGMITRRQK